tara:strand:+ start:408 stop:632 length:225 start_codon:yes stop_codon:yes gene_type:complete
VFYNRKATFEFRKGDMITVSMADPFMNREAMKDLAIVVECKECIGRPFYRVWFCYDENEEIQWVDGDFVFSIDR